MLLLILKSSACLAVFKAFYKLFLEKESVHHFKRFYLLGALLVSIVIPFITFTEYIKVETVQTFMPFQPLEFTDSVVEKNTTWQDYIPTVLWSVYALGVVVFSIRFLKNLFQLIQKIKANPKFKNQNYINVLLQDLIHPHTFFKYIFLNKTKYENNLIPTEVLLHEQTHAKEKHALDILFIEVLQIIFWFNPLLHFIKKDIKLNHEFLADQAVLKHGVDTKNYQNILLAFSSHATTPQLVNAINYSLIKKRFTVMKTKTSKKAFWLKGLLILPIVAILIYSFSEKEIVEKEVASFESLTVQDKEKGATEAMMNEYRTFISEFEKTNTVWAPKLNRAIAIYDLMSDAQRATVKKYPETPLANLAKVKPKTPTETLFNSWKNKTEFAIWIDSKHVPNETLNNYKASDFKYYTSSFVYNNARSKKFPQPYQNNLYTKKGFEASYLKRNVNNYKSLKNDYLKAEKEFINSGKKDDSELRILKARLDKVYNLLSDEEISKYKIEKVNIKTIPTLSFQKPQQTSTQSKKVTPESYFEDTRFIYYKKGIQYNDTIIGKEIIFDKKYTDFTDTEKKEDITIKIMTSIPQPKRKKSPTQDEMDEYKKPKTYAIWIDGESVPNSELNNYKPKDIAYLTGRMFITKKGRRGKYPQPFWCYFYTHDYFEKHKMGKQVMKHPDKVSSVFKSVEKVNRNYKEQSNNTQKDTSKVVKTNTNKNIILLEHWYITINNKKYYYPYKKGDLKKYYDKYGNEVALDIVKEYKNKNTALEKLKNEGKHYIHKTEREKKELDQLYSDLGGMYFRMAKANKTKVNRPKSPVFPYIKLTKKTGKVYYKKRNELTEEDKKLLPLSPPPPPPPVMKKAVDNMGNYSKELQKEAWKAFKTEGDKYGNAVNSYLINKEGKINALKVQYKEVMKLYNVYIKIAKNEKAHTVPPPPPPAQAPSKKQ